MPQVPSDRAERDFQEAAETPGRMMLGIVRRIERLDPSAGVELVGLVDFRLEWPEAHMVYLGMIMVAERYQRQGIGRQSWRLLLQWLDTIESVQRVRLGVEQFNPGALLFFQQLGFTLTGDTNRMRIGDKLVRFLYMEYDLQCANRKGGMTR